MDKAKIKKALKDIKCDVKKLQMRYLVENFDEADHDEIISALTKVCGIHTLSSALSVESDYEKIKTIEGVHVIGHITDKASGAKLVTPQNTAIKLVAQGWPAENEENK